MTLNRFLRIPLTVSCLFFSISAPAGEIITCFNKGALGTCSRPVLQHVAFKSVVLQFVDPANTGLGESLSRLLWREILESISDLDDAGVILAYDRKGEIERALGEENLSDFLERDYHAAANAIARQQKVQMTIWGAVLEDGDEVFVQTFLTLREVEGDSWTTLTLSVNGPDKVRLSSLLGRDRLNLAPLRGSRKELFGREFVTRCALQNGCPRGIALREAPSNESNVIAHVPIESQVRVVDMNQQWLKVHCGNAAPAWINIYHVEVFPQEIEFIARRNVNLRDEPGGLSLVGVDLDGRFKVLNARRYGDFREPWYLIEAGSNRGWVAGRLVSRRSYTFPAVHLIAALYRYGRGQFQEAQEELESFLSRESEVDNVTTATALQFLAASRVAGHNTDPRAVKLAISELDSAAQFTPFDSRVYTLRAVVKVGLQQEIHSAITDLGQALKLNRRDAGANMLLRDLAAASNTRGFEILARGRELDEIQLRLATLQQRYPQAQQ